MLIYFVIFYWKIHVLLPVAHKRLIWWDDGSNIVLSLDLFFFVGKLINWFSKQVVAFLGVLVYKFYGEELREMFGYEEHPYGFYTMAGMQSPCFDWLYSLYCHYTWFACKYLHVLLLNQLSLSFFPKIQLGSKKIRM
jgi:hypothetical protein